jgi:Cdc25 family phosphatase
MSTDLTTARIRLSQVYLQAINVPSLSLDDKLDSLVTDLKGVRLLSPSPSSTQQRAQKDTVIFHCALSQQRGPFAARKYAERISSGSSGDLLTNVSSATDAPLPETAMGKQQVLVLRGGFIRFAESYKVRQYACPHTYA